MLDRKLIELDGTPSKARLGAIAIVGRSVAAAAATSVEAGSAQPVAEGAAYSVPTS